MTEVVLRDISMTGGDHDCAKFRVMIEASHTACASS
jgi:hypothetical protein